MGSLQSHEDAYQVQKNKTDKDVERVANSHATIMDLSENEDESMVKDSSQSIVKDLNPFGIDKILP